MPYPVYIQMLLFGLAVKGDDLKNEGIAGNIQIWWLCDFVGIL